MRGLPQPVALSQALLLRLGCCSYSLLIFILFFFICLCRTELVDYPAGLGKRAILSLGGDDVARFLLSKKHLGRARDSERFRWVPQPVRLNLRVVPCQRQLPGTGSPFVGPESRFYALERQGTPLMHVQQIAEFSICLLYTSPSPRDQRGSRMPSSA